MNLAKHSALLIALAATVAVAQTAPTPAPKPATAKSASAGAAKAGTTAKTGTATKAAATGIKLPPGIPPAKGLLKTAFSLKYQDLKLGTGAVAEPLKLYKVNYTGWLASDGTKFDSSADHLQPMKDKDGKPIMDADGKPKMGDPQPIQFPQGRGRVIPGWDQGFEGMKIGGKRRLFIPWQLAYGASGRPPKIPAKSDLIFDVELVDVADMPTGPMGGMPGRPMPPRPGMTEGAPRTPGAPGTPPAPGSPSTPGTPATPGAPATAPAPSAPASPATPPPASTPSAPPAAAPAPAAPATPPAEPK